MEGKQFTIVLGHLKHKRCNLVPTDFNENRMLKIVPAPKNCLKIQLFTGVNLCICFGIWAQVGAEELILD